jgi:hypothetical protein
MSARSSVVRVLSTASALTFFAACTDAAPEASNAVAGSTGASPSPTPSASACRRTADGEAGDLALARCLASDELFPLPSTKRPVVVYFDRSASMRGFLDPKYPTRVPTDYRSVIDRLVVGLQPARGFSFGAALRPAEPTLATLGSRDFYTDRDTQTEQVLVEIARDSTSEETHIIVTDGRRGSPNAGDAQYVRMREHGARWVGRGGSFVVGTSLAPFQTVAGDPSGCRRANTAAAADAQTCPLYVFGFVAPGDEWRILTAVASVFQHLYIWPTPTIPPTALTLVPNDPDRRDLRIERRWTSAPKGTPIVRVRGDSATNRVLSATITLRDTASVEGRAFAALLLDQLGALQIFSRGFTPAAASQEWVAAEARGSLVRPAEEPTSGSIETEQWRRTLDFVTRGPKAPLTMFRVDLTPTGKPLWLDEFAAKDASDVIRTYGLNRLFEGFRVDAQRQAGGDERARPIGRFFIVAG